MQMTQPPGVRAHLNLQAWLKDAVKDWQQGMRNRTRDAKALYPSGFQIVSAVWPPLLPHSPPDPLTAIVGLG